MKMVRLDWVRLPTRWIEAGGLREFRWGTSGGAGIAALLTLIVIAQHADQTTGAARLTYDQLSLATGLSRATLSAALTRLRSLDLVEPAPALGQSGYHLVGFDPNAGWGKLPARRLYVGDTVPAFAEFKLRNVNELNALKIYLLFVARRDRETNFINLSYDGIEAYSGIDRARIKPALNVLVVQNLVHVDQVRSSSHEGGVANAYRIVHINPYQHMGTLGRTLEGVDFADRADVF